jgi:hypothetical protein
MDPLTVLLPNGATMTSTHTAELPLPHLPPAACLCHIFPQLSSGSLLYIGQLCDHGCEALFTATQLIITLQDKTILLGHRSGPLGHWQWQYAAKLPTATN